QPLEILWLADRALRVCQLAEPILPPGDRNNTVLLDEREQTFAWFPCLHGIHGLVAREQEGQGKKVQLLDLRRPVDGRSHGEVGDPLLQQWKLGRLLAPKESTVKVVGDVDTPLRPMAENVGEPGRRTTPRRLAGDHER